MNGKKILGLLCLLTPAVYAHIPSITVWQLPHANGKTTEIVTVGDVHEVGDIDAEHHNTLLKTIKDWSKEQKKTLFLLESSEVDKQDLAQFYTQNKKTDFLNGVFVFEDERSLKHFKAMLHARDYKPFGSINFKPADRRGVVEQALVNVALPLSQIGKKLANDNLHTQIAGIQKAQEHIKVVENFIQRHPEYKPVLQDDLEQKKILCLALQTMLVKAHLPNFDSTNFDSARWYNVSHRLIIDWVADMGFLMDIVENKDAYDRIVLYAGNAHVNKINSLLPQASNNIKKIVSVGSYLPGLEFEMKQNPQSIKEAIKDLAARALPLPNEVVAKALQAHKLADKSLCHKCVNTIDQMYTCPSCMQAAYCSKECHNADQSLDHCKRPPLSWGTWLKNKLS